MRTIALAAAVLLSGCATPGPAPVGAAGGPPPVLHALEAGLLWHSLARAPVPPGLAGAFGEVCGEVGEAARQEAIEGAAEKLAQARRDVEATPRWIIPLRQTLGGYDLKRGGFEVNLRTGGVVRFDKFDFCQQPLAFLVAFGNGDEYQFIPVADEVARAFVRADRDRAVELAVVVEPQHAQEGAPPVLVVRIVGVTLKAAPGGTVLGRRGEP